MSRKPAEFADWPPQLAATYGPYRAVVRHHVDGDTIDCLIDFGFNSYGYHAVRLLDIDTPEINRAASKAAGIAALDYVRHLVPVGARVLLYTKPDPDSFGRYLARMITADGLDVAHELLAAGHAVGWA